MELYHKKRVDILYMINNNQVITIKHLLSGGLRLRFRITAELFQWYVPGVVLFLVFICVTS